MKRKLITSILLLTIILGVCPSNGQDALGGALRPMAFLEDSTRAAADRTRQIINDNHTVLYNYLEKKAHPIDRIFAVMDKDGKITTVCDDEQYGDAAQAETLTAELEVATDGILTIASLDKDALPRPRANLEKILNILNARIECSHDLRSLLSVSGLSEDKLGQMIAKFRNDEKGRQDIRQILNSAQRNPALTKKALRIASERGITLRWIKDLETRFDRYEMRVQHTGKQEWFDGFYHKYIYPKDIRINACLGFIEELIRTDSVNIIDKTTVSAMAAITEYQRLQNYDSATFNEVLEAVFDGQGNLKGQYVELILARYPNEAKYRDALTPPKIKTMKQEWKQLKANEPALFSLDEMPDLSIRIGNVYLRFIVERPLALLSGDSIVPKLHIYVEDSSGEQIETLVKSPISGQEGLVHIFAELEDGEWCIFGTDRRTWRITIIPNANVSPQHVKIEYKKGVVYITDLRSRHGTYYMKKTPVEPPAAAVASLAKEPQAIASSI